MSLRLVRMVYVTVISTTIQELIRLRQGLALIDAGDTLIGTLYIFLDAMKKELTQAFPELKISVQRSKEPVHDSVIRVLTIIMKL